MKAAMQIVARSWTGSGAVEKRIIETVGDRIERVMPAGSVPLREDALVLDDSQLLLPGLHDAHVHLLFGGVKLGECSFAGVAGVDEFQSVLERYVREREAAPNVWIQGYDLDETRVKITRAEIDRVVKDRPVFLWTHDLHSAVVNSAALVRARIDSRVKDPAGGRYERDGGGVLTGVLRESAAFEFERMIPPATPGEARAALVRAQEFAFSLGLTAVTSSAHGLEIPHYLDFASSSDRKLRLNLWQVSEKFDPSEGFFERRIATGFRFATFKGFADGALGSGTAAFWQPYADGGGNAGTPLVREGPLARFARDAQHSGYQLAIHAIGDRANSICLDAFEMAGYGGRGPEYRPRIEHAQHLRPRDIPRFAELGVIASMQPIHCTADMRFVEPRLGRERAATSYAWKSLLDHGTRMAFGSDWPVEDLSPIAGLHAAVTRESPQGEPAGGWQAQERIDVESALRAYTDGAAYAAFWEDRMGRIEPGYLADFTVLDRDIFAIDPREIKSVRAEMTIVGGEIVYQRAAR